VEDSVRDEITTWDGLRDGLKRDHRLVGPIGGILREIVAEASLAGAEAPGLSASALDRRDRL